MRMFDANLTKNPVAPQWHYENEYLSRHVKLLSVSFIEQKVMVLQCLTITLPWVSVFNSDQATTGPLGILQFVYWEAISLSDRTRSHMLTSASWAFSVFSSWKPPPKVSWSCPSTKWPPDRTVYPTSRPLCWPSNLPFLYSLSSP